MKLSKLYSNKSEIFGPIKFLEGLNVILAEIRLPENKNKDTHNLGKTKLARLIDYCLLSDKEATFFLFKHFDLFKDFVFYLEIELAENSYVTIRRSVESATKISIKKHKEKYKDFSGLLGADWDHVDIAFGPAKDLLDGVLNLTALNPWSYRKGLGYQLRSQEDYQDVFQLHRFMGKHLEWKPYLSHLLGFDSAPIEKYYEAEEQLQEREKAVDILNAELSGMSVDIGKVEGLLLIKQNQVVKKQEFLDAFDFRQRDKEKTKELVEKIDEEVSELNSSRYYVAKSRRKINSVLEQGKVLFDVGQVESLFKEAGVLFKDQIKRDYEQLLAFNKAITEERRSYLLEERKELDAALTSIAARLNTLGRRRSESLSFLTNTDSFNKYKQFTNELVELRTEIASLEKQRVTLAKQQDIRREIRTLNEQKEKLFAQIDEAVRQQNSRTEGVFANIRLYFNEIIEEVIDRKALLLVRQNQQGHLEFSTEILDESGRFSDAASGHTYKKLLCVAFDMAVARAHLGMRYPMFIYHDGIFESLDNRKKEKLMEVVKKYVDLGIQHIITAIGSDLPNDSMFSKSDVILLLHDEGEKGRLFRMRQW